MARRTATLPRPDVRTALLASGPELVARLVHYRPGLHQPTHAHATTQLSFLVLGELEERVGNRATLSHLPSAGLKRAGTAHAARFGPAGALILSIEPAAPAAGGWDPLEALEPCRWYPAGATARLLARAALRLPAGIERDDVLADLVACAGDEDVPGAGGLAPAWLRYVRERMRDAPSGADIATLAREAGVNRVHLSRRFRAVFGMPPSVYLARCRAAGAVASLASSERDDLAGMAAAAGYSDQAHFTRALRRYAGLTPHRLRRCLA